MADETRDDSATASLQHCAHCDGELLAAWGSYVHANPNTTCPAFGGSSVPATAREAELNPLLFDERCKAVTLSGEDYWAIPRDIYDQLRTLYNETKFTRADSYREWQPALEAAQQRITQLQQRVKTFQEGYRDKSFEVTALEIQILDIKATGYDARLERNFEKMKRRCLVAIEERNEARAANAELTKFAEHAPHCDSNTRYPSPPCDCGLSLAQLQAMAPAPPTAKGDE